MLSHYIVIQDHKASTYYMHVVRLLLGVRFGDGEEITVTLVEDGHDTEIV